MIKRQTVLSAALRLRIIQAINDSKLDASDEYVLRCVEILQREKGRITKSEYKAILEKKVVFSSADVEIAGWNLMAKMGSALSGEHPFFDMERVSPVSPKWQYYTSKERKNYR